MGLLNQHVMIQRQPFRERELLAWRYELSRVVKTLDYFVESRHQSANPGLERKSERNNIYIYIYIYIYISCNLCTVGARRATGWPLYICMYIYIYYI